MNEHSHARIFSGVIALHLGLISRGDFEKALKVWLPSRQSDLSKTLIRQHLLTETEADSLKEFQHRFLEKYEGDASRALKETENFQPTLAQMQLIEDEDSKRYLASLLDNSRPVNQEETVVFEPSQGSGTTVQPSTVSRFRILRPHATGGLGEVSVAQDTELNREVAFKEIKDRYADDRECRSRFLIEAEVTGGLEHPGIVPVYGLGRYDNGRPYYAMRFIRGDSLKTAVDQFHQANKGSSGSGNKYASLGFRSLLGRFVDVCQAIEFAHSRGVLHRDLKPGNVMLGKYGETLVVDWGLAKLVGDESSVVGQKAEPTVLESSNLSHTATGSVVGTPAYMPPEQAAGRLDELGPQSDVYSLGATLYYVLTGKTPFSSERPHDILDSVVRGRLKQPTDFDSHIPKALESVCLKAMAVQVNERYASPQELAKELERWMADEAVHAFQDPLLTRVRRWTQRHKTVVSCVVGAVLVGIASLITINLMLKFANDSLTLANEQITREIENVRIARAQTAAVNDFLVNDLLHQADPEQNPFRERTTVVQLLDRASERISSNETLTQQPLVAGSIQHTIGTTYYSLGEFQKAKQHLRSAVEIRQRAQADVDALESQLMLAEVLQGLEEQDEALKVVHDLQKYLPVDERGETQIRSELLRANIFSRQGDYAQAEAIAQACLDEAAEILGEGHSLTNKCRVAMAQILTVQLKDYERTLALHEESLAIARRIGTAEDSEEVLAMKVNLAEALGSFGEPEKSKDLLREVLETRRKKQPDSHPAMIANSVAFGVVHSRRGEHSKAASIYRKRYDQAVATLGPDHFVSWFAREHLAGHLLTVAAHTVDADEYVQEAELLLRKNLETCEKQNWSPLHADGIMTRWSLAKALIENGKAEEARRLLTEWIATISDDRGEGVESLGLRLTLAQQDLSEGKFAEAIPEVERIVDQTKKLLPPAHIGRAYATATLAGLKMKQRDYKEADELWSEFLDFAVESKMALPEDFQGVVGAIAESKFSQKIKRSLGKHKLLGGSHYYIELNVPDHWVTIVITNPLGFVMSVEKEHVEQGACRHFYAPVLSGTYEIHVIGLREDLVGHDYQLSIQSGKMEHWKSLNGTLDLEDEKDDLQFGFVKKEHALDFQEHQKYTVTATSEEFDPFARLESSSGVLLATDNNSGSGNSARIDITTGAKAETHRLTILGNEKEAVGSYSAEIHKFEADGPTINLAGQF